MKFPWPMTVRRFDLTVAAGLGLFVFLLSVVFAYPALNPEIWNDVAAAAGLRPPVTTLGGYIRAVYRGLFAVLPPDGALFAIRFLGWLSGGVIAFLAYFVIRNLSGAWIDIVATARRGRLVSAVSLGVSALAFSCVDFVWSSTQGLSAVGIQLILTLSAVWAMTTLWKTRRMKFAFLAMGLCAVLAADTPAGLIGVLTLVFEVFCVLRRGGADETALRLANPLVRINLRRFLTLAFLLPALLGIALECGVLRELGGYAGIETWAKPGEGFSQYFKEYGNFFLTMAAWKTWVLAFAVVVAPFVVARLFRDKSMEDDHFIPTNLIVAYGVIGVVAASQVCGIRALAFVNWFDSVAVGSPLFGAGLAFLSAVTMSWTILILSAAVILKRPHAIARFRFDDANDKYGRKALRVMEIVRRYEVPAAAAAAVVFVLCVVLSRYEGTLRGMLGIVDDYLKETVDECPGVNRLFTDGSPLDTGIELEAFRRGKTLYTVALMGGGKDREVALRTRGLTAEDDITACTVSAGQLLRMWIEDVPERLNDAGLQLAFEMWRPKGLEGQPLYFGTVALPPSRRGDATNPDFAACSTRAQALAERIIGLYADGEPDASGTRRVQELFRFVQWRVSQFCLQRATVVGRERWTEAAEREQSLGDRLRDLNRSYRDLETTLGRLGESRSSLLTPREGLRFALQKANFRQAAMFAESVILSDPDDPQANFAIGMDQYMSKNYARAEPYLKRCHEQRPDDPAVLNNLAVVELRLYRYEEAEKYARQALSKLPGSPEIQKTLDAILKAAGK